MFILLLLLLMLAGDLLWWRSAERASAEVRSARYAVRAFALLMITSLALIIVGRALDVRLDAAFPRFLLAVVFLWHMLGLPIAAILGSVRGVASIARRATGASSPLPPPPEETPVVVSISRRAFLGRTTAVLPAAAALAGAGVAIEQLGHFRVRRLDVPIRNLPSGIDGLTIAHVSDVHLGTFTTAETYRRIVAATNDLDADLVLQTGDLINFDQRDLPVATSLTRDLRGRHGQFICEGNHDLIQGRSGFINAMRQASMPLLSDEFATLRINNVDLQILGLPWSRSASGTSGEAAIAQSVERLAAKRSAKAFPILLAHHPHAFDAAAAAGIPLTLSGHTHGGQLALSKHVGFGPLMYRYWSGLYERDGTALIVSNGVGNWFPLRVRVPAEILHLTLRRA